MVVNASGLSLGTPHHARDEHGMRGSSYKSKKSATSTAQAQHVLGWLISARQVVLFYEAGPHRRVHSPESTACSKAHLLILDESLGTQYRKQCSVSIPHSCLLSSLCLLPFQVSKIKTITGMG